MNTFTVSNTFAVAMTFLFFGALGYAAEPASQQSARKPLKLPGLVIDFDRQCVDIEATVCVDDGLLELVACTKGSKEHESIVAVSAKAMHIHTALLLLGANNGSPSMRKQITEEDQTKRWVNVPPTGDAVDVLLVVEDEDGKAVERPISDYVLHSKQRIDEVDGKAVAAPTPVGDDKAGESKRLPHTFVFAGSHLKDNVHENVHENGAGPRLYLADVHGNVISIATFGDETLCLPTHETQANHALMWRVNSKLIPKTGTKVTLRLRPHLTNTEAKSQGQTSKSNP